jgi:glycogen operon protein
LRNKQKKNLLGTLLFSRGVPMLVAGDELGRTQEGNNNAYCQDNELSWLDWGLDSAGRELLEFVARLVRLRATHPAFKKRTYSKDIAWLAPDGGEMSDADWKLPFARCTGALFPGEEDLLLLLNAHDGEIGFALPEGAWNALLDTTGERAGNRPFEKSYPLQPRSVVLLLKARSSSQARTDA